MSLELVMANDPDGVTEPMVSALRAVQFATGGGGVGLPNVVLTSPVDGAQIDGLATLTATASDPQGITSVDFLVDGVQVGSDSSSPYAVTWDTDQVVDGLHTVTARATDGGSTQSCVGHSVTTGHPEIQGDWVGAYGSAGYVLGAWNGTSDLAVLPGASLTLLQGDRFLYGPNGEARSVENATETERRQAVVWDDVQVRLRLDFPSGFSGPLDVYAVDYDTTGRRQTVTVDDGSGPVSRAITTSFSQGAWIHYMVNVAPGGSVSIVAARTAGANAVISGVFLGPAGPPASGGPSPTPTPTPTPRRTRPTPTPTASPTGPPPPVEQPGKQGDWVGSYGSVGYVLAGWNGSTDLAALPSASFSLLQGNRYLYGLSTEARAVENPSESERRHTVFWDDVQIRLKLDFPSGFSGPLDIYAVDVDTSTRRQTVTVDDGSGPVTRALTGAFSSGAWLHYTVNVPAGGSASIVVARTAGPNAVISGIFLGPAGPPASGGPTPTPTPTPTGPPPAIDQPGAQGDWVGAYGSAGYVLGAWNGTSDLAVLPGASLTLLQGDRFLYGPERRGALGRERDRDRAPPGGRLGRRPGPSAARLPVRLQRSARRLCRRLRHDRSPSDGDRR